MVNPVIIGKNESLRSREMFQFMKDMMNLNQSVCMTTKIINDSFVKSSGVWIEPDNDYMYKYMKVKKPWILVGKEIYGYSRVDEPLYSYTNGSLFENYKFKSLKKKNLLGVVSNKNFVWNDNFERNLFSRRGNFENIELIAMTDHDGTFTDFPSNEGNVSKVIPKTIEVCIAILLVS